MSSDAALPKTCFAVLANGRSGSNMLVTSLDAHPEIRCMGEVLNPSSSFGFENWRRKSWLRKVQARYLRDYALERFHDQCLEASAGSGVRAAGFKLIYPGQFDRWPGMRCYWRSRGFKVVTIVRKNLLRKHVSGLIAREDDVWSSSKARDKKKCATVNLEHFWHEVERTEAIYSLLDTLTLEFRGIRVAYEDLLSDYSAAVKNILDYLEVDASLAGQIAPRTARQNPWPLQDLIENWDEVSSALRGTPYDRFLRPTAALQ